MADRNEPEREAGAKADYRDRDSRDREAKEHYASRDYAGKDYRDRDYTAAKGGSDQDNKVFVGGLHYAATKEDIHSVFSRAGRIVHISLVVDQETQRSKGYAFITFADEEAYMYALNKMDGVSIMGKDVVVKKALNAEEKARMERERGGTRDREAQYASRPHHGDRPHYDKPPGPKSKGFRVTIHGLPESYTWRELKDFLRNTTNAQPTYANVDRPGLGVGEWATSAERASALRLLDGMTLEGARLRCEPLEEERGGHDGYGPGGGSAAPYPPRSERGGGGGSDHGYGRDDRGRGGGGGGGYEERYYSRSYDGPEGAAPRGGGGGGYDDRYPDKYSGRGDGAGRAGSYDDPPRYDRGGPGSRYEAGGPPSRYEAGPAGGGSSRYDSGGYGAREGPRDAPGYGSRDAGYPPRDPVYSPREGGARDAGGYGGPGGGYSSRNGGGGGGGYSGHGRDYPTGGGGGGRSSVPYEAPYPDKYAGRGGEYGGSSRGGGGGYPAPEPVGRSSRYEDADYDAPPPRRDPGYGAPPRDPYAGASSGRDPGYPPRERAYPEPRAGPTGSGGRDPGYERAGGGGGGYERSSAAPAYSERGPPAGYDRGGAGYERPSGGYDRGADHYGYERDGTAGYKNGGGGGYGGSGRPPAGAGPPPSSRGAAAGGGGGGGGYPPERYEGTGRGGPDRHYASARGGGYERSAPY